MDYHLTLGIIVTSDFQVHSTEFTPLEAQMYPATWLGALWVTTRRHH